MSDTARSQPTNEQRHGSQVAHLSEQLGHGSSAVGAGKAVLDNDHARSAGPGFGMPGSVNDSCPTGADRWPALGLLDSGFADTQGDGQQLRLANSSPLQQGEQLEHEQQQQQQSSQGHAGFAGPTAATAKSAAAGEANPAKPDAPPPLDGTSGDATLQESSAADLGQWPALQLFSSNHGFDTGTEGPLGSLLAADTEQQDAATGAAWTAPDAGQKGSGADVAVEGAPLTATAAVQPGPAMQPTAQAPAVAEAPRAVLTDADWELSSELEDYLYDQQQLEQEHMPGSAQAAQGSVVGAGCDWDDELDDLIMEQQELMQPEQQPERRSAATVPAAAAAYDELVADLDAELDELDGVYGAGRQHKQQHHCSTAAGAAAAVDNGEEMDLGDELDHWFEQQGDAAMPEVPISQAPCSTTLKPPTLASLGTGAAAAKRRAAASAVPVIPPRQLASAVQGPVLTVTGSSGQRVYCQLDSVRPLGEGRPPPAGAAAGTAAAARGASGGLLTQPLDLLLDQLAAKRRQEMIAEYEAAQALAAELADDVGAEDAQFEEQQQQQTEQAHSQRHSPKQLPAQRHLWVDKYAPRSFLALLSEPRINREIAAWVAKWSKHQHGQQEQNSSGKSASNISIKQPAMQQQQQRETAAVRGSAAGTKRGRAGRGWQHEQQQQEGGSSRGKAPIAKGFDAARYQAAREARAAAKILLVVGPPGTGKTSLAHVVAQHCGFRVVEINASDERTAASLTRRITDVAQMQSVIHGSARPPCIVLDELDGAANGTEGHSAVAALVKLITGDGSNKRGKRGGSKPSAPGSRGLGIPIIATANDAYAPCLRPLRDIAGIYHFKPPQPDRIMKRLATIAAAEGIGMDRQALHALVDRSGSDMRTCINTLQLLARQAAGKAGSSSSSQGRRRLQVTAAAVMSSGALGVKDVSQAPLTVLNDLLMGGSKSITARLQQLAAASTPSSSRGSASSVPAAVAAHLQQQQQYNMLLDLAEHDLILCGLAEALPDAVGLDVDLSRTLAAAQALADADSLLAGGSSARSGGGGSMFQYVPSCLLMAARLLRREQAGLAASNSIPWPRAQAQCASSAAGTRALLRSWRASAPAAAARQLGCGSAGLLELGPALAQLSRPVGVKAVSKQLLSTQHAALLDHVVACMVAYGITYSFPVGEEEQQPLAPPYAAAPGQPLPRPAPLKPAIDTLHCYSCLGSTSPALVAAAVGPKGVVPLVIRQMLSQMISAANITRIEQARHHGELLPPTAAKAAGTLHGPALAGQQPPAGAPSKPGIHHTAAAKAAVMPAGAAKPAKGCWLDALKARAAPKRKAAAAVGEAGSNKRAATEVVAAADPNKPGSLQAVNYDVLYKFNEGYTNAVKRPMKVHELLD